MVQLPLRISSLSRSLHFSWDKVPAGKYCRWNVLHDGMVVLQGLWQSSSCLVRNQDFTCEQHKCSCNTFFPWNIVPEVSACWFFKVWINTSKHRLEDRLGEPSFLQFVPWKSHSENCSYSLCRQQVWDRFCEEKNTGLINNLSPITPQVIAAESEH